MNETKDVPVGVRKYMAKIGRKGGAAGRGTEWRREACRHAVTIRWRNYREKKRKEAEAKEAELCPNCGRKLSECNGNCIYGEKSPVDNEAAMYDISG